jgi:hypothetical protein
MFQAVGTEAVAIKRFRVPGEVNLQRLPVVVFVTDLHA